MEMLKELELCKRAEARLEQLIVEREGPPVNALEAAAKAAIDQAKAQQQAQANKNKKPDGTKGWEAQTEWSSDSSNKWSSDSNKWGGGSSDGGGGGGGDDPPEWAGGIGG